MEETEGQSLERLRQLVETHEVCWEVQPLDSKPVKGDMLQVGYALTLSGIFNDPQRTELPLRDKLDLVLESLRKIAADLQATVRDEKDIKVTAFDPDLQMSPVRESRIEAGLKLAVTHVAAFHTPADAEEAAVVKTLQARLHELGACKGAWKKDC